ncbi:hypothetical protein [Bifidobacterium sp. B4142]|uniref:hypothetical protein n=1 Tax=Bifidobacterium sp. B4142 TaxID=2817962 RepID=UPI00226B00B8|nr:hypothetical protein [Bifidobacterium sp. B4142]MCX8686581.1 hypothetical protein [Bifidobacterium sp. B4142]
MAGLREDPGGCLFPSKTGAEPQYVTSSGGWTLAVGGKSKNPELTFEFVKLLGNREFSLEKDIKEAKIAVRSDVAKDPKYLATNAFRSPPRPWLTCMSAPA